MALRVEGPRVDLRATIDGDSGPLYRRLARALQQAIEDGEFEPGSKLPTERALAGELGLSSLRGSS